MASSPSKSAQRPIDQIERPRDERIGELVRVGDGVVEGLAELTARLQRPRPRGGQVLLVDGIDWRRARRKASRPSSATGARPARVRASPAPRYGARRAGNAAWPARSLPRTMRPSSIACSAARGRSAAISTMARTSYASACRQPAPRSRAMPIACSALVPGLVEAADTSEGDARSCRARSWRRSRVPARGQARRHSALRRHADRIGASRCARGPWRPACARRRPRCAR